VRFLKQRLIENSQYNKAEIIISAGDEVDSYLVNKYVEEFSTHIINICIGTLDVLNDGSPAFIPVSLRIRQLEKELKSAYDRSIKEIRGYN
jgi:hypothetical protein